MHKTGQLPDTVVQQPQATARTADELEELRSRSISQEDTSSIFDSLDARIEAIVRTRTAPGLVSTDHPALPDLTPGFGSSMHKVNPLTYGSVGTAHATDLVMDCSLQYM